MSNEIGPRIGNFFLLIGVVLLILFIGSILGEDTNLLLLITSTITIFLGYLLWRGRTHPEPTRFSAIRKANQRTRQRREEKRAKKEKKDDKITPPSRGNF